ncbi:MAG: hypothetical protein GY774_11450 [Planctomycetes bacterium]|nr:hypothetical protein [Planctomycetota bacterium]
MLKERECCGTFENTPHRKTCAEGSKSDLTDLLNLMDEMSLMLDLFNSCIVTGNFPAVGSKCHKKILELIGEARRKPTAMEYDDVE